MVAQLIDASGPNGPNLYAIGVSAMPTQIEIRKQVTDRIVSALEKGIKPWVRPWSIDGNMGHPTSFATKKRYNGINPILLDLAALEKGYESRYWGTFGQWKKHGASVKPGEKCTYIIFFDIKKKTTTDAKGNEDIEKYAIMKYFAVFNIDQTVGSDVDKFRADPDKGNDFSLVSYEEADRIIESTGASIHHGGNSAHFRPIDEQINIPLKKKFKTVESYYSTLFHELSHWSDFRNGAKAPKRFGDDDYFFGELVAEISANYLCTETKIPSSGRWDDSIDYLGGWIERMKKDSSWIFKASTRASQASDYILSFTNQNVEV